MKISSVACVIAAAPFATASARYNLNYQSWSSNHPELAVKGTDQFHKRDIYSGKVTFTHGVASGDPYANSVIIWTRAVPPGVKEKDHLYNDHRQICVHWEIASDQAFQYIANQGYTQTSGDVDFTVKVEATKLQPLQFYYYRFQSCDESDQVVSDVGRTKTFPKSNQDVNSLRLAVYSCANYAEGYYNAYGNPAKRDAMDYVLFLGDYQYEFVEPSLLWDRWPQPFRETVFLDDYRIRIATQRTDPDLRLSHEKFPWISVWDDHEVADNGWNNGSHREGPMRRKGVTWQQRKLNGMRAYFEWMPIRQVAADNRYRIWRSFQFGKLADLMMLDTRYYNRDKADAPEEADWKNKTMLGADQEAWLYGEIEKSQKRNATWKIFGNQVQFSNMNDTAVSGHNYYGDGWLNYRAIRNRFIQKLVDLKSYNNIFLTGDYHALWTSDLMAKGVPYDWKTGEGSIGVELATTSVSSYSGYGVFKTYEQIQKISERIVADNYQVKWAEGYYRGYMIVEFTPKRLITDYYSIPTVRKRNTDEIHAASWVVDSMTNRLKRPFPKVKTGVLQTTLNPWAVREA